MAQSPSFLTWLGITGTLLLVMALSSAHLRRLPVSNAGLYLLVGVLLGPVGLGYVELDFVHMAGWLEHVTELGVVLSLFVGGLKLREPLGSLSWRAPLWLAGPIMLATIAGVMLLGRLLGLSWPLAMLLGAVLAPTDPVLASAVAVGAARDRDRLRYALSGEAGLNDGTAFPFVIFALTWLERPDVGAWLGGWALHRLLWAVPAGLLTGFLLGRTIGRLAVKLRSENADSEAPSEFLAMSLVALSYVAAELIGAWGFLSVFAAGVGLRRAELAVVAESPHPEAKGQGHTPQSAYEHPPAEELVPGQVTEENVREPAVAAGVLVAETIAFGDISERVVEVALVVLVGASLVQSFTLEALGLGAALLFLIRPLWTELLLRPAPITTAQRRLVGWFGIRGIGSLYYLSYALTHGLRGSAAERVVELTISTIALSIVVHGVSSTHLLAWYERRRAAQNNDRAPEPPRAGEPLSAASPR